MAGGGARVARGQRDREGSRIGGRMRTGLVERETKRACTTTVESGRGGRRGCGGGCGGRGGDDGCGEIGGGGNRGSNGGTGLCGGRGGLGSRGGDLWQVAMMAQSRKRDLTGDEAASDGVRKETARRDPDDGAARFG